ncbi:unnamed protein product [Staurois parvus]|uniref:Uncharacterized protein n=1 Tax=Staurois parvus TaxID=386267 RepID=A0ABN9AX94_9NEOB|nr:unnamed protein product [Staurois parvus]
MGPPGNRGSWGPWSVGGPMRCPWYLFYRLFEFGQGHRGPMIPYCPGAP